MAHQSLDHDEVLNLRWATVDPNPLAQKREAARIEEQAAEAVRRALPADFVAELEGRETPEMKRRRLAESGFGLDGYEAPDEVWFARSRELEQADKQAKGAIEPPAKRFLLANGNGKEGEHEPPNNTGRPAATQTDQVLREAGDGMFSGATLAALESHDAKGTSRPRQTAAATINGLLVGYGSDDDED